MTVPWQLAAVITAAPAMISGSPVAAAAIKAASSEPSLALTSPVDDDSSLDSTGVEIPHAAIPTTRHIQLSFFMVFLLMNGR
ncbi:MAG TPA: hypothetical protein VNO30_48030 [Kofleriaceae bacterium]|nr:hypothetical protein [Kofleriaceae bacterium]